MELFKLIGSIFVDSDQAERAIDRVGNKITALSAKLASVGKFTAKWGTILAGSLPALAGVTAGVGALGASLVGAGTAFGAFGAVAIGVLGDVFNATEENFGELTAQQQKAYKALQGFKSFWSGFKSEFEAPIVQGFSTSLQILQGILNNLKPAIKGVSDVVNKLLEQFNTDLQNGAFKKFFDWINTSGVQSFQNFASIIGNLFGGLLNLFMAFAPLASQMEGGLVNLTQRFQDWSASLSESQSFQNFISYVQTYAPVVIGIIGNLFDTIVNIVQILAPFGGVVITIVGQIAQALNMLTSGNFAGLGDIFINMFNTISALLPQVLTMIQGALTSLIQTIMANAPQIISTLIGMIQTWLSTMATIYPMIIQAGTELLIKLIEGLVKALPQIVQAIVTVITNIVQTILTLLPTIIQAGIQILQSLIQGITQLIPQLIPIALNLVTTILNAIISNLPMIIQAGIQLIQALVEGIINMLPQLVPMAFTVVNTLLNAILTNLPQIIQAGIQLLLALIEGIVSLLPQLVTTAIQMIIQIAGALLANLPQIITAGVQIIIALAGGLIKAIPQLIGAIPQIVSAIFTAFTSVDWSGLGSAVINGVIGGIKAGAGAIWNTVTSIFGGGGDKKGGDDKKKNANGTKFFEGGWTMVGEQGMEMVRLPRGSEIIPNHALPKGINGSQGGITQNITIISPKSTASEIARKVKQASHQLALES